MRFVFRSLSLSLLYLSRSIVTRHLAEHSHRTAELLAERTRFAVVVTGATTPPPPPPPPQSGRVFNVALALLSDRRLHRYRRAPVSLSLSRSLTDLWHVSRYTNENNRAKRLSGTTAFVNVFFGALTRLAISFGQPLIQEEFPNANRRAPVFPLDHEFSRSGASQPLRWIYYVCQLFKGLIRLGSVRIAGDLGVSESERTDKNHRPRWWLARRVCFCFRRFLDSYICFCCFSSRASEVDRRRGHCGFGW